MPKIITQEGDVYALASGDGHVLMIRDDHGQDYIPIYWGKQAALDMIEHLRAAGSPAYKPGVHPILVHTGD